VDSILQQDVHSYLPLFDKVLYRREKRACLHLKSSLSRIWVREGGMGDLKFSAVLSWCLIKISKNKEISNKKKWEWIMLSERTKNKRDLLYNCIYMKVG